MKRLTAEGKQDIIFSIIFVALLVFAKLTQPPMETDFIYRNKGTIVTLLPQTDAARAWCDVNLPAASRLSPDIMVIEYRNFPDIVRGIVENRLTLKQE